MVDDAYTRNEDGELAVRTVSTSGDTGTNPNDVFTRDDEGRLAIRTTGGGGDQHNLGYFATQAALEEAHPTAEAGDWAIVGATDTVWLWDSDNSEWVDSDQKGQVTSVNNQTGAVTLTASDVGAATTEQGAKADTAVQPADLATVATTGDYDDLLNKPTIPAAQVNSDWNANSGVAQILNKPTLATVATTGAYSDLNGTPTIPDPTQVSTMPTASADNLGDIVQFTGTTDASYTNGYFYKCVSDGLDPATYSWTQTDVQPAGATYTAGNGISINANNEISVTAPTLVNTSTLQGAIGILGSAGNSNAIAIGTSSYALAGSIAIGQNAQANAIAFSTAVGYSSQASRNYSVGIGALAKAQAQNAIQIGSTGSATINSDANTMKVANANGNYEIMSADGTIPADRLTHAINKYSSMPTASVSNLGWIVQYTGTTDSTYTHGYIYECVSDGGNPATYSWTAVQVQAGGGGSSYTAGTGIDITSGVISVDDPVLINKADSSLSVSYGTIFIGGDFTVANQQGTQHTVVVGGYGNISDVTWGAGGATFIGDQSGNDNPNSYSAAWSVAVGYSAKVCGAGSIMIGVGTNPNAGTFAVGLGDPNVSHNVYEVVSADGTIPEARLADTTSAAQGQVLTLDSNLNAVWAAGGGGGGSTSATATLAANAWSNNSQTVNVTGVTANNNVIVAAAPASQADYTAAGILCTAQGAGTLTFTCTTTPTSALTVNVIYC